MNTPIILIIFNRLEITKKTIEAILVNKPTKVYLIADGPRDGNKKDIELCSKTRHVAESLLEEQVELIKIYSEINLGCGKRISTGITEVFEKEEKAIIIEDDILVTIAFMKFSEEMLEKYKHDERVMMISGSNYYADEIKTDLSYYFSIYGNIHGWATWKRAWKEFDFNMKRLPNFIKQRGDNSVFTNKFERLFWLKMFALYHNDKSKPWGIRWFFSRLINHGLSIMPAANLVQHIGVEGTHTKATGGTYFRETEDDYRILKEPECLIPYFEYDNLYRKKLISTLSLLNKLKLLT